MLAKIIDVVQIPKPATVIDTEIKFTFKSDTDLDQNNKYQMFIYLKEVKDNKIIEGTIKNAREIEVTVPRFETFIGSRGYSLSGTLNNKATIIYTGSYTIEAASIMTLFMHGNVFPPGTPQTLQTVYVKNALPNRNYGLWFDGETSFLVDPGPFNDFRPANDGTEDMMAVIQINVGQPKKEGENIVTKRLCLTEVDNATMFVKKAVNITCRPYYDILVKEGEVSPTPIAITSGSPGQVPTPTPGPPTPGPSKNCTVLSLGVTLPPCPDENQERHLAIPCGGKGYKCVGVGTLTGQADSSKMLCLDPKNGNNVTCVLKTPFDPCKETDAQGLCTKIDTGLITFNTDPAGLIKSLFGLILSLAGGIALLLIIYSGYRLMTSQGDPEKVKGAKETITSAIVGLLFIIFSFVILEIIGINILNIPGFHH